MTQAPVRPIHLLGTVAAGMLMVFSAVQPVRDIDLWWHRWVGDEIVATGRVQGLGNAWAPFGDQNWTTTQWLSEVTYSGLHAVGGYSAITGLRLFIVGLVTLLLAQTVVRGKNPIYATAVYAITVLGLAIFVIQDRPQTLVMPFAVILGGWLDRLVREPPHPPAAWLAGALTWLWANLHGSWVTSPATFALVAMGQWAGGNRTTAGRAAGLAGITAVAGLLTPAGPSSATAILRFSQRTTFLGEWEPVEPLATYALPLAVLLSMSAATWALRPASRMAPLVVVIAVGLFGLAANRSIPIALVLLAPIVSSALSDRAANRPSPAAGRRGRTGIALLGTAIVAGSATAALVVHARMSPDTLASPRAIAATLATRPEPVRVLNTYQTAGVLLEFSGGNVELGIDGRADRYTVDYAAMYFGGIERLEGVDRLLATVEPDVAVLGLREALTHHLLAEGWILSLEDGDYVLLEPGLIGRQALHDRD